MVLAKIFHVVNSLPISCFLFVYGCAACFGGIVFRALGPFRPVPGGVPMRPETRILFWTCGRWSAGTRVLGKFGGLFIQTCYAGMSVDGPWGCGRILLICRDQATSIVITNFDWMQLGQRHWMVWTCRLAFGYLFTGCVCVGIHEGGVVIQRIV